VDFSEINRMNAEIKSKTALAWSLEKKPHRAEELAALRIELRKLKADRDALKTRLQGQEFNMELGNTASATSAIFTTAKPQTAEQAAAKEQARKQREIERNRAFLRALGPLHRKISE
jgi:hypothetical protein